jgi:hypothetical protein
MIVGMPCPISGFAGIAARSAVSKQPASKSWTKGGYPMKTRSTIVKDLIYSTLFVAAFLFIGSGMLEAVLLKLLEVIGW